jgi:hypothetical protein
MGYDNNGDSEGAARRHLAAAKIHEAAGTDAMRDGDSGSAEGHYTAADLHRRAASMHSAGIPVENDDDEDDEDDDEMLENMVQNYAGDDPLPQPGFFSPPQLVRNVRPETLGDTLDTPTCILHNVEQDAGPRRHSWDSPEGERTDTGLGTTVGNPQFGDRITPRQMTPAEFLEEAMAHDHLTRENRKRMGLPEEDVNTDDLLLEAPGAIGTILGEMKYKGR